MSCLYPLPMYRDSQGNKCPEKYAHTYFHVPCGQCGECRMSNARSKATRCVHEASQWKLNCFITLTYKSAPPKNSLNPIDTKLFLERFRYHFNQPFKYFLCGEYGEKNDRPHYHALIFGYDFGLSKYHDKQDGFTSASKLSQKESSDLGVLHDSSALSCPELDKIWGLGHTSVGELTFDSAAYCAQYAMKKVTGAKAKAHYGERHPEFMRQSQNAIGKQYALQYADEIIYNNSVISNGVSQPIPNYYLKLYEKQNHDLTKLKQKREEFSQTHSIEKSYIRACQLDSKFKLKISKSDAFRIRYAKNAYFQN